MKVKVIRGSHEIGGSIIEVDSKEAKIILDAGMELNESYPPKVPAVEGLFQGTAAYNAIIVSHYHQDHTGLLNNVVPGIPIYMTAKMALIDKMIAGRTKRKIGYKPIIIDEGGQELDGRYSFGIKDIAVTPFLCDHSAFDSYMYLLSDGNDSVLYTGDFRSNGRKSFDKLLTSLPNHVGKLLMEGTTLSRESNKENETEDEIEEEFFQAMSGEEPVFVMTSSSNIDRITSIYQAAIRAKWVMAVDAFQAGLLEALGEKVPEPGRNKEIKVIQVGYPKTAHAEVLRFKGCTMSRKNLCRHRFVMLVRGSEPIKRYIEGILNYRTLTGATMIYSLWRGYMEYNATKEFLGWCREIGMNIVQIHTSGHADRQALQAVIDRTHPDQIVPVHTEHPDLLAGMKDKKSIK